MRSSTQEYRVDVCSLISGETATLEEVLEAWRLERLSDIEDNIQIIRVSHHPASIWKQALHMFGRESFSLQKVIQIFP